jgi:hypothetical protein
MSLWNWKPSPDRLARQTLSRLADGLDREYRQQVEVLAGLGNSPQRLKPLARVLPLIAEARAAVLLPLAKGPGSVAPAGAEMLAAVADRLTRALRAEPPAHGLARRALVQALDRLVAAQTDLTPLLPRAAARPSSADPARRVIVPPDFLYQAHHDLFPAERMLVVSGRRSGDTTRLGVPFDVTGDRCAGHVKADPRRLARALIAMELSGTHLACWVHSHPGAGPGATFPSSIDLSQHEDWIRDYTPALLGVIVVEDRWVRLWGTALETKQTRAEVIGPGVIKESDDEHLYRLAD